MRDLSHGGAEGTASARATANWITHYSRAPARHILFEEEAAEAGHHPHVNAGHQTMSNTDTRVSVIVGVCQQDPERWREFDAIYRPMLFAYLRKQGLQGVRCQ